MSTEQELKKSSSSLKEFQNLLDEDFKDRKLIENKVIKANHETKNWFVSFCSVFVLFSFLEINKTLSITSISFSQKYLRFFSGIGTFFSISGILFLILPFLILIQGNLQT